MSINRAAEQSVDRLYSAQERLKLLGKKVQGRLRSKGKDDVHVLTVNEGDSVSSVYLSKDGHWSVKVIEGGQERFEPMESPTGAYMAQLLDVKDAQERGAEPDPISISTKRKAELFHGLAQNMEQVLATI